MTRKRPGPPKGHPNYYKQRYPVQVTLLLTEDQKARVVRAGQASKVIRGLIDKHLPVGGEDESTGSI